MTTASTSGPPLPPFAPENAIQKGRVGEGATDGNDEASQWPGLPLQQWKDTCAKGNTKRKGIG
jgi:nuclear transport factor 2 (NTF2) superfamily protein